MERQIVIDWNNVKTAVSQHLSYIGKRLQDKNGDSMFAKVTMSSEELKLLHQYVNAAAETFVGELAPLVTYYNSGDFLIFKVESTRWGNNTNGVSVPFEGNFMGYTVAYIANAVLGMNYPDLAKKYETDMQRHLDAAIKLIFIKQPPIATGDEVSDMVGEVEL